MVSQKKAMLYISLVLVLSLIGFDAFLLFPGLIYCAQCHRHVVRIL